MKEKILSMLVLNRMTNESLSNFIIYDEIIF
jgi:hypothetical protein